MAEEVCTCGCHKPNRSSFIIPIIVLVAVIILHSVYSCRKEKPQGDEGNQPEEEIVIPASEIPKKMLEERLEDPEYTSALNTLADWQGKSSQAKGEAQQAYMAWRTQWVATNEVARALAKQILEATKDAASVTNGTLDALRKKLDQLVESQEEAKPFLAAITKAEQDAIAVQQAAHAVIGEKLLDQSKKYAKHEAKAMAKHVEEKRAEGNISPILKNLQTNTPPKIEKREEGWYTNTPQYKAQMEQMNSRTNMLVKAAEARPVATEVATDDASAMLEPAVTDAPVATANAPVEEGSSAE